MALQITAKDIRQETNKRKFLVRVSEQICRDVVVEAADADEAFKNADMGKWSVKFDVVKEETIERWTEEILEEDYEC